MKRLTNKRRAERDAIVLKYYPRIAKTVQSFVKKNPQARYLQDDMNGEAAFWVLHAANRHVCVKPIQKMPGYMHQCIMTGIMLAIRGDKGVQKPRANPAKKVGGTQATAMRFVGPGGNGVISYSSLYWEGDEPTLIDSCCRDDIDIDILLMTYRGRSHVGISRDLKITVRELKDRKVAIKKRLDALESGEADVSGSEDGA